MVKTFFSVFILIVYCLQGLFAQDIIQSRPYPQNYFRYPLTLPPVTAGSFGELRPNHFHSGLDFKTNQVTGYPVHAVADGYVSRLYGLNLAALAMLFILPIQMVTPPFTGTLNATARK